MHLMRIGAPGTDKPVARIDDVRVPRASTQPDWEVELGIHGLGSRRQEVIGPI